MTNSKSKNAVRAVVVIAGLAVLGGAAYGVRGVVAGNHGMMNHGAMNHGAMNHGAMDHSSMGHGSADGSADHSAMGHGGMDMSVPEDATPATRAYIAANAAMHADMSIEFTNDADVDFIKGMIPHHEGAVAMAQIVLEYGQDEEAMTLAREIIVAQESEIAWMQAWLAERGH